MTTSEPICIWPVGAELGEGPVWSAAENALYFVDIKGQKIHRFDPHTSSRLTWPVAGQPGFLVPMTEGRYLCGIDTALYEFRPGQDAVLKHVLQVEPVGCGNRLNDGFLDQAGRIWLGSMDDQELGSTGALYQLSKSGSLRQVDRDYVITNGPAMSPDGRILYHVDTLKRLIYAFDVDSLGCLHNKRCWIRTLEPGWPDGMAVDVEGCLWVAFFGGGRIDRYAPSGELIGTVRMPCTNVTKLAFGGQDLCTAYVTTARKGLSSQELTQQPMAGGLFSFNTSTPGLPLSTPYSCRQ